MMSTKLRILSTSFVSLLVITIMFAMIGFMSVGHSSAAQPCVVKMSSNHFDVDDSTKTVTGYFEVTGDANCKQDVSVMTWFADSRLFPDHPEFWTSQTINAVTTKSFGVGTHSLDVKMPVCDTDKNVIHSYQADVIAGSVPSPHLNAPGTGGYYEQSQEDGTGIVIDAIVKPGTCPVPTPPTTTTPTTPAKLPSTGAGNVAAIFGLTAVLATAAYYLVVRRKAAGRA